MSREVIDQTQNPLESPFYSPKIAAAVERDLGLGREDACVLLLPGNHVITPESLAFLEQVDMIAGEFNKDKLIGYMLYDPSIFPSTQQFVETVKRFRNPGYGANPDEQLYQHKAVRRLIREGKTFVASEGSTKQLDIEYDPPPLQLETIAGIWGISSLAGSGVLASGLAMKAYMDRRQLMALTLGAAGVAAISVGTGAAVSWYDWLDNPREVPLGRNILRERINVLQKVYERVKEKIGLEHNIFQTYSTSLVDVTNAVWVLNGLHSLATSVSRERSEPLVMALLYGSGHGEIEDLIAGGVASIEQTVERFANSLLTESLDRLVTLHDEEYLKISGKEQLLPEDEDWLNQLVSSYLQGYAALFPDPYKIGGPQWPEDNLAAKYIPPSARAVLLDRAQSLIAQYQTSELPEAKRRIDVLSTLVRNLLRNSCTEMRMVGLAESHFTRDYPFSKKVGSYESYDEVGERIFTWGEQPSQTELNLRENYTFIYANFRESSVFIGAVKFNGSYYPVYRGYKYDSDTDRIISLDMAWLQRNQFVRLPQREYLRITGRPSVSNDELLVRIKRQKNGRSSLFIADPLRNKQIWGPNDIYFQGEEYESDPLKIGAVALELVA